MSASLHGLHLSGDLKLLSSGPSFVPRQSPVVSTASQSSAPARQHACLPPLRAAAASAPALDLASQPLSTYNLPLHQPRVATWLENCIKDAVRHIDDAPFVQLYLPGEGTDVIHRHRVTEDVVQAPQMWQGIAQHLARATPEVLVLVHPIHLIKESAKRAVSQQLHRSRSSRGSPNVMTGVTARQTSRTPRGIRQQQLEDLIDSGVASTEITGRVGEDCCEDEIYSQVVPFSPPRHSFGRQQRGNLEQFLEGTVQYHGVVVQCSHNSDVQGCYVLKTVQSVNPVDCQCTHYTLTRVARGQPLAEQLAASWLC